MISIMNLRKQRPSEPYDFKVDRTTPLGNPHPMMRESDREGVCDLYEEYFKNLLTLSILTPQMTQLRILQEAYKKYGKLRLFCWCAPKRCHAETIKKFLEETREERDGK